MKNMNCTYLWSCVLISSLTSHLAGLDWKRWEKIGNGRNLRAVSRVLPFDAELLQEAQQGSTELPTPPGEGQSVPFHCCKPEFLQVEWFQICITKPQVVLFFTTLYLAIFVPLFLFQIAQNENNTSSVCVCLHSCCWDRHGKLSKWPLLSATSLSPTPQ